MARLLPARPLALLLSACLAQAQEPPGDTPTPPGEGLGAPRELRVVWENGFRVVDPQGEFELRLGGRVHLDLGAASGDALDLGPDAESSDGARFRRARIETSGTLHGNVRFNAMYEFGGGDFGFRDLWFELTELGPRPLRFGLFREALGLEANTSSNFSTFIERPAPSDALTPGRNIGIGTCGESEDGAWAWYAGAFRPASQDTATGQGDGNGGALTARTRWLPIDEERRVVHLGLAASVRDDDRASFAARPENFLVPDLVDTGTLLVDSTFQSALELAWVDGPWSLQGELFSTIVDLAGAGSADLLGAYAEMSWFPTGESRPYDHGKSGFGRVEPRRNHGRGEDSGPGAIELAARHSWLDLDDGSVSGGELSITTLGANWYLNPSTRLMLNVLHVELESQARDADMLLARFQIEF